MKADMQKPRIVFMGAGAMGSYIGGRIAQGVMDDLAENLHQFVGLLNQWRELGG